MIADSVSAIVNEQVIVAVELQLIEAQHEPLQDRFRLEGHDAIDVRVVLRAEHGAVDLAVDLLQKVALAQRCHVI